MREATYTVTLRFDDEIEDEQLNDIGLALGSAIEYGIEANGYLRDEGQPRVTDVTVAFQTETRLGFRPGK